MLEINMTCLLIESLAFGTLAEIWVADAHGYWAHAAGGVQHSGLDRPPDIIALIHLLLQLKRNGFIVGSDISNRSRKRLTRVIEKGDIAALGRAILWPEHPEYGLGVRYKDGGWRKKSIRIDDKIWKQED